MVLRLVGDLGVQYFTTSALVDTHNDVQHGSCTVELVLVYFSSRGSLSDDWFIRLGCQSACMNVNWIRLAHSERFAILG